MTESEIAFAGIARQAEMVRDGEITLGRPDPAPPRSDRSLRRPAQLLPRRARRSGACRGGARPTAGSRRARPRRCSASRSRSRMRSTSPASSPRTARRPSIASRSPTRLTTGGSVMPARSCSARRPCRRSSRFGRSPRRWPGETTRNPWDTRRTPGRLERRFGRGRRGRSGRSGLGLRRRRLDPDPGLLLRACSASSRSGGGSASSPSPSTGSASR